MHISFELLDLMKCQIANNKLSHTNDDEIPIRLYTIIILYLIIVSQSTRWNKFAWV